MSKGLLFDSVSDEDSTAKFIGRRLYFEFKDDSETHATLYHNDVLVKTVDLTDKVAKKLFVVGGRRAWRCKNPSGGCA